MKIHMAVAVRGAVAGFLAFLTLGPLLAGPEPAKGGAEESRTIPEDAVKVLAKAAAATAETDDDFLFGVITDREAGQKALAAAKSDLTLDDGKAVVFAVLRYNSNQLRFEGWSVKNGVGTLQFMWNQIQPYYHRAFPALFAIVEAEGLREIQFDCHSHHETVRKARVMLGATEPPARAEGVCGCGGRTTDWRPGGACSDCKAEIDRRDKLCGKCARAKGVCHTCDLKRK